MAAILENLDGAYNEKLLGQKMKVTVAYQSASQDDPFGKKIAYPTSVLSLDELYEEYYHN